MMFELYPDGEWQEIYRYHVWISPEVSYTNVTAACVYVASEYIPDLTED